MSTDRFWVVVGFYLTLFALAEFVVYTGHGFAGMCIAVVAAISLMWLVGSGRWR